MAPDPAWRSRRTQHCMCAWLAAPSPLLMLCPLLRTRRLHQPCQPHPPARAGRGRRSQGAGPGGAGVCTWEPGGLHGGTGRARRYRCVHGIQTGHMAGQGVQVCTGLANETSRVHVEGPGRINGTGRPSVKVQIQEVQVCIRQAVWEGQAGLAGHQSLFGTRPNNMQGVVMPATWYPGRVRSVGPGCRSSPIPCVLNPLPASATPRSTTATLLPSTRTTSRSRAPGTSCSSAPGPRAGSQRRSE